MVLVLVRTPERTGNMSISFDEIGTLQLTIMFGIAINW